MVQLGTRMAGAQFGLETQEVAAECVFEQARLLSRAQLCLASLGGCRQCHAATSHYVTLTIMVSWKSTGGTGLLNLHKSFIGRESCEGLRLSSHCELLCYAGGCSDCGHHL